MDLNTEEFKKTVEELNEAARADIFSDAPECEGAIGLFWTRLEYVVRLVRGGSPRLKPYNYHDWVVYHYVEGEEQFIACHEEVVLRAKTKGEIESLVAMTLACLCSHYDCEKCLARRGLR